MKKQEIIEYNYGVDILKILAMIMIVGLHILGHGGILNSNMNFSQYSTVWSIEILCICGVNCFAIVSGFVGYKESQNTIKISNYIQLWLQVAFYSLGISLIFFLLSKNVGLVEVLKSALPITFGRYWYFSAYTGLFFLMPFLNIIANKMEKRLFLKSIITCTLVFSIYNLIASRYGDPFKLNNGFSVIWLCMMYTLGAFVKKYELYNKIKAKVSLSLFIFSYLFMLFWFFGIGKLIGHGINGIFDSYISFTVVGMSLGLLLFFSRLNVSNNIQKFVKFFSPAVFGVYLIHDHAILSKFIIKNNFTFVANDNVIVIILEILLIIISIFVICALIDKLRIQLFKLLHVKQFAKFIDTKINLVLDKMVEKI